MIAAASATRTRISLSMGLLKNIKRSIAESVVVPRRVALRSLVAPAQPTVMKRVPSRSQISILLILHIALCANVGSIALKICENGFHVAYSCGSYEAYGWGRSGVGRNWLMADTAWAVRWRCRIFVSHDREFVSGLATRVIEVRTDGTLTDDLGTYDEYLQSQRIDG